MTNGKRTVAGLLAVAAPAIALRVIAQPASTGETGVCCIDDPISCITTTEAECVAQGGIFGTPGSGCGLFPPNPFGACTCGPGAGSCTGANGTPGCELLKCCEPVCLSDTFCCAIEWDQNCAAFASQLQVCFPPLPPSRVSLQAHLNVAALGGGSSGNDAANAPVSSTPPVKSILITSDTLSST